ncbi:hypothetical protein [Arthrobacter sp. 35W]|uniref:hypothetical protein n=1 Tax=Arthrobacter sp. 35W TaxID=1132441 RepID=UPI000412D976|nr:hypothetical protein [Arthrobacter sp. 35W]
MTTEENHSRLFPATETIASGPWRFQLRGDELADIEYRGRPVLRAIRAVVRDHNWSTLAPSVAAVATREEHGAAVLALDIDYAGTGAAYRAVLTVSVDAAGLSVAFDGEAPAAFASNRIGLVVLHRPDDTGRAITVGSPDGSAADQCFPSDISPHQPFLDVSSMAWKRDGTAFSLEFNGDTFETEDQRNWTDASFKTYSTPLSRPFPVAVAAGDRVHQSIRLAAVPAAAGSAPAAGALNPGVPVVRSHGAGIVPGLSTSASTSAAPLQRIPGMDALLVELGGSNLVGAADALHQAQEQAAALGVPLDVRLAVGGPDDLPGLLDLVPLARTTRLGVFDSATHVTEPALWQELNEQAGRRGFTGTLLAGARSHFTELNRASDRLPADAPALVYSITPQMHSTEVAHIIETLPIQRQTALNALRLGSGRPLHIGPVTLRARFNAVATDGTSDSAAATDPLQGEDFTAAWLLGSIAALTLPGVETMSCFEAAGARGLLDEAGTETPAGRLFTHLASLRGAVVLAVDGGVPGLVLYPVRAGDGAVVLFAANLTAAPVTSAVDLDNGRRHILSLPAFSATAVRLG